MAKRETEVKGSKGRLLCMVFLLSSLVGCASLDATSVEVRAETNPRSDLVQRPFAVRLFIAEMPESIPQTMRRQLLNDIEQALRQKGYTVVPAPQPESGVVRISYAKGKRMLRRQTVMVPSYRVMGRYPHRFLGIDHYYPVERSIENSVDELDIRAFDANAGWVWSVSAQTANRFNELAVYPDLFNLIKDYLGREMHKTFRVPKPRQTLE